MTDGPEPSHSSGLLRRLGLFTATMIVMGNMIGSGIFKKSAPMAAEVQSAGLLLGCWLLAGVISLCGALANAEAAGMIADPGGQYAFFKKMFGRQFAYLFGWSSFTVMQSASIASIAYVFGESANSLFTFPRLSEGWEKVCVLGIFYPFDNFGVKAFTILTRSAITLTNYLGVVYGGFIANITMALKLLGIAVVAGLGLCWAGGSFTHLEPVLASPSARYGSSLGLFGAMFSAMLGAFWAYDGWSNVTCLGAEVRNPQRNIPLALGLGVGGVIAVYMVVNLAYLHVMPVEEMRQIATEENRIIGVEVMRKAFGDSAARFVAVLILLSTFGSTGCQLMPPSRMYFAMARDHLFFRAAAKCHPAHRTPSTSLVMQGVWASLLVLTGTFDQLTDMVIFASFIFYGASALGIFVLRRTMKDAHRPYRVHGYPIVPALFVLFCLVLVVVTIIQRPRDAGFGLALIFSGVPFYLFWSRRQRPGG
jgi:APA family basic amino acid/polyamine antiporter